MCPDAPHPKFGIVTLHFPFAQEQIGIAHLWEHLVLYSMRERNPGYLFWARTDLSGVHFRCAHPGQDLAVLLKQMLSSVYVADLSEASCIKEYKILQEEQKQRKDTSIPSLDACISTFHTQMLQQHTYFMVEPWEPDTYKVANKDPKTHTIDGPFMPETAEPKSHDDAIIHASIMIHHPDSKTQDWLGSLLAMYLSQAMYKSWIQPGLAYQANVIYQPEDSPGKLTTVLRIDHHQGHQEFKKFLEQCRNKKLTIQEWKMLQQKTWLYRTHQTRQLSIPNPIDLEEFQGYMKFYLSLEQWYGNF